MSFEQSRCTEATKLASYNLQPTKAANQRRRVKGRKKPLTWVECPIILTRKPYLLLLFHQLEQGIDLMEVITFHRDGEKGDSNQLGVECALVSTCL